MTGYEAFTIYNALKLHFETDSYDFFKYNGKSRITIESFENRKDKYYFYKLSRRQEKEDYIQFLVSNLLSKEKLWVGDLLDEQAVVVHKKRMSVVQSLTYKFKQDCEHLRGIVDNANELFKTTGDYPILLTETLQGTTQIETLCILNDFINFFPLWNKKITDTIRWPNYNRKCMKYTPFIQFDKVKYRQIAVEALK
jgi:uncharacterized iron-regulated protein